MRNFQITILLILTALAIIYLMPDTFIKLIIKYPMEFLPAFFCSLLITYANWNTNNFQKYFHYSKCTTGLHIIATAFYGFCLGKHWLTHISEDLKFYLILFIPFALVISLVVYADPHLEEYFKPKYFEVTEEVLDMCDKNLSIEYAVPSKVCWSKLATLSQFAFFLFYITIRFVTGVYNKRFLYNYLGFYTIIVLMMIYNFYCMSKWAWIKFERKQERIIYSIHIGFFLCILKCSPKKFASEFCTICFEKNPTRHFCANHCFHENCLIGYLINQSKVILEEAEFQQNYEMDYLSYLVKIKRDHMPFCPNCKAFCVQNTINIGIRNTCYRSMFHANIKIID